MYLKIILSNNFYIPYSVCFKINMERKENVYDILGERLIKKREVIKGKVVTEEVLIEVLS